MADSAAALAKDVPASSDGLADGEGEKQPSIAELLDELIGLDRSKLVKILGLCVSVLLCISSWLIHREVVAGRNHLALVYGGFVLLTLGLVASVAFVLYEATRLEDSKEKKSD
eukprot:TRINITY_DN81112_c0_g1_i1.p1 TRINITY_DN81112_c0_g1~~TRINITY_DN81112_c0_g1_i1.p1  ORF type:complete len:113 (-),score=28.69 TRINITY_DN81112_c0_g1_i1:69-407(-)